jgi:hypothetical protein
MSLIKLTCACFLITAAAAIFTIAFGTEQAAKPSMELCKHQYALCTYRSRMIQRKQFAFALWRRARACPRRRATQSNPVPMPMVSARCIPHFRSNNSSRVRKCFGARTALPGHGVSISVAQSIHLTPRKRSVSATYCELKNGLRWAAIATPPPAKQGTGRAQR